MAKEKITAKEFLEKDGRWNGKMYAHNVVYKNDVAYEIIDSENLKAEKKNEVVMAAEKLVDYAEHTDMNAEDIETAIQHISYALLHISEKSPEHKDEIFAIAKQLHTLEGKMIAEKK